MKTIAGLLMVICFFSCQKDIIYRHTNKLPPVKIEQPEEKEEDTLYREEPSQDIYILDITKMLRANKSYKITEYYCSRRNLWEELGAWIKDDIFCFHESGNVTTYTNNAQHPQNEFEVFKSKWKLYAEEEGLIFEFLDQDYASKSYKVVAFEKDKSFTLQSRVNDLNVYLTFSYQEEN